MQMVKKILLIVVVSWFALLAFMPKKSIYYKLEEELAKQDVKINEERIEEGVFSLKLINPSVYVKGVKIATLSELDLFTLLIYTSVELDSVVLDESLKNMLPTQIEKASATHSVLMPMEVSLDARGAFGGAEGTMTLSDRLLRVDFNDTQKLEMLKPRLKNDEKGWYYETAF